MEDRFKNSFIAEGIAPSLIGFSHLLLTYRLKWYRVLVEAKLLKFKHVIILLVCLFIPTASTLISTITASLLPIFNNAPGVSNLAFLGCLLFWQAVYLSWVVLQKTAIRGGVARDYFYSLPISRWQQQKIDLYLLIVANNLLWLPILITILLTLFSQLPLTINPLVYGLQVILFISTLLALQINWLNQRWQALAAVVLIDAIVFINHSYYSNVSYFGLYFLAIILVGMLLTPFNYKHIRKVKPQKSKSIASFSTFKFSALKMQFIIWRCHRLAYLLRLMMILVLMIGSLCILFLEKSFREIAFIEIILITLTYITTGFYPLLDETQQPYRDYLQALPVAIGFWAVQRNLTIIISTLIPSLFLILMARYLAIISNMQIVLMIISQLLLCILLYPIRIKFKKQGTTLATAVAVAWGWAMIYYLLLVHYAVIEFNSQTH